MKATVLPMTLFFSCFVIANVRLRIPVLNHGVSAPIERRAVVFWKDATSYLHHVEEKKKWEGKYLPCKHSARASRAC